MARQIYAVWLTKASWCFNFRICMQTLLYFRLYLQSFKQDKINLIISLQFFLFYKISHNIFSSTYPIIKCKTNRKQRPIFTTPAFIVVYLHKIHYLQLILSWVPFTCKTSARKSLCVKYIDRMISSKTFKQTKEIAEKQSSIY